MEIGEEVQPRLACIILTERNVLKGRFDMGSETLDTAADETAIRHIFEIYSRSWETGDAEAWMALWDEEGVQLPYYEPMHIGKPAIREANFAGIVANKEMTAHLPIVTQEVKVFPAEGYGFARGLYHMDFTPKTAGAKTASFDGKFLTVFRREANGSWKILRDCFNLNTSGT
jgi:uncharacterized protein (TIGR02246 family)